MSIATNPFLQNARRGLLAVILAVSAIASLAGAIEAQFEYQRP